MENKPLPHDELSERAVLGAMLINERYIPDIFKTLKPEHFFRESHQEIFKAIDKLSQEGMGVDTVTVSARLKKADKLKYVGGHEYIISLIDGIPENLNLEEYIKDIISNFNLRQVIAFGIDITKRGYDPATQLQIEEILNESYESLQKISDTWADKKPSFLERIKAKRERDMTRDLNESKGFRLTEFKKLQEMLDGIQSGVHLISGESHKGKTAFLLSILLDIIATNSDVSCLYFSLDDDPDRTSERIMSVLTGIGMKQIDRKQKDKNLQIHSDSEFEKLCDWLESGRLDVIEDLDIESVKRITAEAVRRNPKTVVFIDSFNLLNMGGLTGLEADEKRAGEIRRLFVRHSIPIWGTFEVRKGKPGGNEKRKLKMDDILGSGKTGYNSEVIFLLQPADEKSFLNDPEPILEINCVKNKVSGNKGDFYLQFDRATLKVIEIDRVKRQPEGSVFDDSEKE